MPLERQPVLALARLVANAGRLVTRAELQSAIWPEDTHVCLEFRGDGRLRHAVAFRRAI